MLLFPSDNGGNGNITLIQFIDDLYLNLLGSEWKLNDIEEMDIIYYLKLLACKSNKENNALTIDMLI
jgi:hypothetical protein